MNLTALGRWLMSRLSGGDGECEEMTLDKALSYPPVWHCVSKIGNAFVVMPLNVMRLAGRDKSIQDRHPSYKLLRWKPNAYQTPGAFKCTMMVHALMYGDGRAYIRRETEFLSS